MLYFPSLLEKAGQLVLPGLQNHKLIPLYIASGHRVLVASNAVAAAAAFVAALGLLAPWIRSVAGFDVASGASPRNVY